MSAACCGSESGGCVSLPSVPAATPFFSLHSLPGPVREPSHVPRPVDRLFSPPPPARSARSAPGRRVVGGRRAAGVSPPSGSRWGCRPDQPDCPAAPLPRPVARRFRPRPVLSGIRPFRPGVLRTSSSRTSRLWLARFEQGGRSTATEGSHRAETGQGEASDGRAGSLNSPV